MIILHTDGEVCMPTHEQKNGNPNTITVEIPPARPYTAQEKAEYAREKERAEYHSAPRPEFDTVSARSTSSMFSDTSSSEFRDGRGNVASYSLDTLTGADSATLRCKDGRVLPEDVAKDALAAVQKNGPTTDGWFTDTYQSKGINPLESACRADHNRRAHKGREPN